MFKKNEPPQKASTKPTPPSTAPRAKEEMDDPGFQRGGGAASTSSSRQGPRAVVGASVVITGEISGSEDISIYGQVKGDINLMDNHLTIGNSGKIDANVRANSVDVDGNLKGEVFAGEKITIRKSGVVSGNITAPRVVLEDGCRFEGKISMNDAASKKSPPPKAAQVASAAPNSSAKPTAK